MDRIFLIGITAAVLTTLAFLPQVIKAAATKQTKDLSLAMFVIFSVGISFWLVYGILLKEIPIILANSITLALSFYIIFLKRKYG